VNASAHVGATYVETSRHPLVDARRSRAWSQETLALLLRNRGLGTTRKSVTRWERGVTPDSATQQILAELFEVTNDARLRTPWPNWLPSSQVTGVQQTWDHAGTIDTLAEVAERAIVDRREFLALVGPELLLPIYTWRLNPGPWLVYRAHGEKVSPALVTEMERLTSIRRHMDDEHGGGALLDMLHADLRFVTEMLKHGSYDRQLGQRLYAVAAELCRLAGWAADDSGLHAAAQQYYLAGLRAASAIGDHALSVNIVGFLGTQAYAVGRLHDSVHIMDVATAESHKTPAIVQAMTWARSARAYAKLGERNAAWEQLDKSSGFLSRAIQGDTPPWAYWVDQTRLTAQIGRALFDLGDYRGAERDLSAAVAACEGKYPRDRATWQGRIAIAQLRTGKLEEACASGRQTIHLVAGQVDSERALGYLRTFSAEVKPFGNSPAVREFSEYARSRLEH
jgi:transcriptional regulator with XRE-family HTH domain